MGADSDGALILWNGKKYIDNVLFQGFSHSYRRPLRISFCKTPEFIDRKGDCVEDIA